jgi:hypothetical protein
VWWHLPVFSALRRLRLEDHEFQLNRDCRARSCLKNKNKERLLRILKD